MTGDDDRGRKHTVIGSRTARVDASLKVTGGAIYGHDLVLPGMLHGRIVRSPVPHAILRSVDVSRARRVPGVVSVITGKDAACQPIGFLKDQPVLKADRVRCVRDEIAAVAAVTEEAAEEACRAIDVEYEPLPAVFDPFEAMKPEAPLLHQNAPRNRVPHYLEFKAGDAEKVLEKSEHVVEGSYRTPFTAPACPEPSFAAASFDSAGRLSLWASTQVPFYLRDVLSKCLGIPGYRIKVIQPSMGGAFGARLDVFPYEVIAALLARASGRPVTIAWSGQEEVECCATGQAVFVRLATGVSREGRLTARKCEVTLDAGAYTSWSVTQPQIMLMAVASLYRVENVAFRARSIYTNNPPSSAWTAYGNPPAVFAVEQQMDELARKLGMDPMTFRMLNANKPESTTPQKLRIRSCGLKQCIETAAHRVGIDRRKEKWEGVGLASAIHMGGGGRMFKSDGGGAVVKLSDYGKVSIITGAVEAGSGSTTALAMIAAEELGVPLEWVHVVAGDTDTAAWDAGSHSSRTTFVSGNAVLEACRKLKKQVVRHGAKLLGCAADDIEVKGGRVICRGDPSKSMALDRLVRAVHFTQGGEIFIESAFYDPPSEFPSRDMTGNLSATYTFTTHAVRLRVDPGTGRVRILKYVAVNDNGKVINRGGLAARVEGGIQQGLALALAQQLHRPGGEEEEGAASPRTTFRDYRVLTFRDSPEEIDVHFVETDDPVGPFGAKGAGETGCIPVAAAVANAIADAVGVRPRSLPITPDKVLALIRNRGGACS